MMLSTRLSLNRSFRKHAIRSVELAHEKEITVSIGSVLGVQWESACSVVFLFRVTTERHYSAFIVVCGCVLGDSILLCVW